MLRERNQVSVESELTNRRSLFYFQNTIRQSGNRLTSWQVLHQARNCVTLLGRALAIQKLMRMVIEPIWFVVRYIPSVAGLGLPITVRSWKTIA